MLHNWQIDTSLRACSHLPKYFTKEPQIMPYLISNLINETIVTVMDFPNHPMRLMRGISSANFAEPWQIKESNISVLPVVHCLGFSVTQHNF